MAVVIMPDGAHVDMPDNPTPEQLDQLRRLQSDPSMLERAGQVAKRTAGSFVAGFGKAASLAPLAISGPAGFYGGPDKAKYFRDLSGSVADFYDEVGKKYGLENRYGRGVAESVGGSVAFGGVSPMALLSAAGSGVGSELAGQVSNDNGLARFVGGLAGGLTTAGVASKVAAARPQSAAIAREATEGITNDMLEQAREFQRVAAARGMPVDLAQALKSIGAPADNLEALRNFVATKPQGNQLQAMQQAQPGQLATLTENFTRRLPGTNYGEGQAANNLQDIATDVITGLKRQRSDAVRGLYARAQDLPPSARRDLAAIVQRSIDEPGASDAVKAAGREFIGKLSGGSREMQAAVTSARTALAEAKTASAKAAARQQLATANAALEQAGSRPLHALDVDTWIGELTGPFKPTVLNPGNPKASGHIRHLGRQLNERFQQLSPEVQQAEQTFARMSQDLINPAKKSVLGRFATARGAQPDVEATMGRFAQLMERGTDVNAANSDVISLGQQLGRRDPAVFSDALKSYISMKTEKALSAGGVATAEANRGDFAQKLSQSLWKDRAQARGLRDAVSVVAQQQGRDPVEQVAGLNRLIQLVDAAKSRAPGASLRPEDIAELGRKTGYADTLRIFGFLPFERAARRMEDAVLRRSLSQFDRILTDPEGAALLAQLARLPPGSRQAYLALANFGASTAQQNPLGTEQPTE